MPSTTAAPPDWRTSGSPSSPKVTWAVAPRLGWHEVADYAEGAAKGAVEGAAEAGAGLWRLVSAPVDTVKPLVTHPVDTLSRAAREAQQKTGEAFRAAREGRFEPAGRQLGRHMGSSAVGTAAAAGAGALVGKAGAGVAAARAESRARRWAQSPEARARRIESNHATDAPLVPSETVLKQPIQLLTEAEARAEALRLERQDRGHSWDRHGPQLTPADHRRRVTTGVAADRAFSPTKVSTQFHKAFDWVATREKALRYAEARYGLEAGKPPNTAHGQPSAFEVILEYNRPIDHGMVGAGPKHAVQHPVTGKSKNMHTDAQPIEGVTRTKTTVAWDPAQKRWVVVQHMPWAEGWDNVRKAYKPEAKPDATGVVLANP